MIDTLYTFEASGKKFVSGTLSKNWPLCFIQSYWSIGSNRCWERVIRERIEISSECTAANQDSGITLTSAWFPALRLIGYELMKINLFHLCLYAMKLWANLFKPMASLFKTACFQNLLYVCCFCLLWKKHVRLAYLFLHDRSIFKIASVFYIHAYQQLRGATIFQIACMNQSQNKRVDFTQYLCS